MEFNLYMIEKTLELAEKLQNQIQMNISSQEKKFHQKMQNLLNNPKNKIMLIELLDCSFRSKNHQTSFEFIEFVLSKYGIADFFNTFEKVLLFAFLKVGCLATNISVPFFIKHLRTSTKNLVLDSNSLLLEAHLRKRKDQNIILNINLIGEEVLGEIESESRIQKYEEALKKHYITYISIKITTIFSQINILDFEYSKKEVMKRLKRLYALAQDEQKKQGVPKFINLDMEEFKDLELTVEAFMESIEQFDIEAGIVLQAYIPDSYEYLKKLLSFSKKRVLEGKSPIKIRFVKGANMESEETIAAQKGWELPTFSKKVDTDANYNKMLNFVLQDDNYKFIKIGIASHNIFEIAYAYIRISSQNAFDSFTFEMLEGMSLQCSYEVSKMHNLILYAPVCDEEHFNNAIAYLVRRLDENTSENNFMRYFFNIKVGDSHWNAQKELFLDSLKKQTEIDNSARRTQDRNKESILKNYQTEHFNNEPDTDFILPQNRTWATNIKMQYEDKCGFEIYPVIGKEIKDKHLQSVAIYDKIKNIHRGNVYLAGIKEIKYAIEVARKSKFNEYSFDEIHKILAKVAKNIRDRRGALIGISALEVGKTFAEVDAEVSEAIDFLEFYPHALRLLQKQNPKTTFKPKGIGACITPWNFPVGISAGTITAPLSCGNTVIYKPSSLSTLTGYMLCECFWDAGIPKDALIFLPSKGSDISNHLLSSVEFAILTGGEDTAYAMLKAAPGLMLSAETGGKNATIVSKMADREQAIKNVIHSAFSNSGQKCSATSLLILEQEVYDDEEFKKALVDAASSLAVGNPFELKNKLGAKCNTIDANIQKALNEIAPYEEWVLESKFIDNNPYLMTPCIKYGTKEGDFTHTTELFAPILSVMYAKDLRHAIDIAHSTGYGLTAGLESLDEREWEYFHTHIEAGNIYINKPTTGAIVLRQPFGGIKKSAIGFGRKVGIYNYITQFVDIKQDEADEYILESQIGNHLAQLLRIKTLEEAQKKSLHKAIIMAQSYAYHAQHEFLSIRDYVQIRGEDNLFSYSKVKNIAYRMDYDDEIEDALGVIIAAHVLNIPLYISHEHYRHLEIIKDCLGFVHTSVQIINESDEEFSKHMNNFERIRYFNTSNKNNTIFKKAAECAKVIATSKPLLNGRFELLYYHNEKSLSISYHRYGNLGSRSLNK